MLRFSLSLLRCRRDEDDVGEEKDAGDFGAGGMGGMPGMGMGGMGMGGMVSARRRAACS